MALQAIKITIGQALGGGTYNASIAGGSAPDIATILTDITTALGNASGSTDSTDDITVVQTDATALTGAINADLTVVWNTSTITTQNQLKAALQKALLAAASGIGGLTP